MRALWSGVIQFGQVVLPVKPFPATAEHQVRLREIHAADSGRVQHRRFCEAEDREIGYEEVGRGWELPDGQLVPLTDRDLERLPLAIRHVVEVLGFVSGQDIDPIPSSRPYYVGPGSPPAVRAARRSARPHRTGRRVPGRRPLPGTDRTVAATPRHAHPPDAGPGRDELRDPGDLAPSAPVTDRELELAEVLMREFTGVEVDQVRSEYRHAIEQLVEAKVSGGAARARAGGGLDGALEESVRAARAHQGG
jgi:DNA end-binding protein Ku